MLPVALVSLWQQVIEPGWGVLAVAAMLPLGLGAFFWALGGGANETATGTPSA